MRIYFIKRLEELIQHQAELRDQWVSDHMKLTEAERVSINQRLHEMNKLREQITAERGQYLTRDTYDREHKALTEKVDTSNKEMITKMDAVMLAQTSSKSQIWFMGAVITLIVSLVSLAGEVIIRLMWR